MASTGRNTTFILLIMLSIVVFLFLNMVLGSVRIPMSAVWHIFTGTGDEPQTWQNIIWKSRFPQALTALVAGAGLSISGLQMQTVFRNPLAGPSVLGISSGASMGVAFVVLFSGSIGGVALSHLGLFGEVALSIAAIIGSLSVMALIVFASHKVKGNVTLLIIGVMIGYLANAIIGVLKFFSVEEDIKTYVIWGLGSFSRVSGNQMMLVFFVGENIKLIDAGGWLCPESGIEYQTGESTGDHLLGCIDGYCHGLLRSDHLFRIGSPPPVPGCFPNFGSPAFDAGLSGYGRLPGSGL